MVNVKEIKVGDIFSEISHYVVTGKDAESIRFSHIESKMEVLLSNKYVENLLKTADSYTHEVKVGKVDKANGDPGIRTIWESIHSEQVFTVCFKKQGKKKTKKSYEAELKAQREAAMEMIEKARRNKKSMAQAYTEALQMVQDNPIVDFIDGEDRVLRGYKMQFSSIDGRYSCMDMDIKEIRPVNINTIKWLVFNGVRYVVE